jgi:hypothetical protein
VPPWPFAKAQAVHQSFSFGYVSHNCPLEASKYEV